MRLGAQRDGTLTAIDPEIVLDIGSGNLYAGRYTMTLHQISELYRCPSVRVRIVAVYTNTSPTGPQRGVLDPIATSPRPRSTTSRPASAWIRWPCASRLRGGLPGPRRHGARPALHLQAPRRLATVADAIGWADRDRNAAGARSSVRRGVGHRGLLHRAQRLRASRPGRRGGAARRLGGGAGRRGGDRGRADHGPAHDRGRGAGAARRATRSTTATPTAPTTRRRATPRASPARMGPAVLQAASLVRRRLCELVGARLEVSPLDLVATKRIHVREVQERGMSFTEACALMPEPEIRATGSRAPNPDDVIFRLFGAHGAEVEVDVETGELRVLRIVCSHDIGRPIDPKLVESQQFGGAVMGSAMGSTRRPSSTARVACS